MAVTVAAVMLTVGCSTDGTVDSADLTVTPPAVEKSPAPPATGYGALIGLPLSAYGLSEQDDEQLFQVRKALVTHCMKGLGHKGYSGQDMVMVAVEDKEAARPIGAWGYIGARTAKRLGFHPEEAKMPSSDDAKALTAEEEKDSRSCTEKVGKDLPSLADTDGGKLTDLLFGQSFQRVAADSRVATAREQWSTCMTKAGHPADDPEELAAGPWDTPKPTKKEISAATAAESCTASSGLAGVYFAVLAGYQKQLISGNATALNSYQKQVREHTDRAAHLQAEIR
ncbi:hypothetical protein DVK44_24220 [Streptomyces paludis]|uniref:Uncharacterized protein n=1 Tax=Streptomyces paludis TaxID=2282738 RepID=A0A345I1P3_9ACTN|nr:hypothetical protein DVK44_24220 [Streptomyces paludis]